MRKLHTLAAAIVMASVASGVSAGEAKGTDQTSAQDDNPTPRVPHQAMLERQRDAVQARREAAMQRFEAMREQRQQAIKAHRKAFEEARPTFAQAPERPDLEAMREAREDYMKQVRKQMEERRQAAMEAHRDAYERRANNG